MAGSELPGTGDPADATGPDGVAPQVPRAAPDAGRLLRAAARPATSAAASPGEHARNVADAGLMTLEAPFRLPAWVRRLIAAPCTADAPWVVLLGLTIVAFVAYSIINQGHRADLDYYMPLADAFLHGRLYVLDHPSYLNELVPFAGHYYVVYPPAPAVLLVPFVILFGPGLDQARVAIALGAVDVALAAAVAYRVVGPGRWIWLLYAVLFGFGTTFWYEVQSGNSWHLAHVVATMFLLLAIIDIQHDGPPWRIGLLLGGAALSRLPALLAVPFALAYIAWRADHQRRAGRAGTTFGALGGSEGRVRSARLDWSGLARGTLTLGLGLAIPLMAYAAYNVARFGSPLQEGYDLIPGLMQEHQYRFGFLAFENVGRNLFAMLLSVPNQVDQFPFIKPRTLGGLSIFLTTPAFIWAFRAHRPTWFQAGAWLSIFAIMVPIVLHADPGGAQFGYRYAIDFYPFAFLLMIHGMRGRLNLERTAAIALCFLVNAWGIWAIATGWVA